MKRLVYALLATFVLGLFGCSVAPSMLRGQSPDEGPPTVPAKPKQPPSAPAREWWRDPRLAKTVRKERPPSRAVKVAGQIVVSALCVAARIAGAEVSDALDSGLAGGSGHQEHERTSRREAKEKQERQEER